MDKIVEMAHSWVRLDELFKQGPKSKNKKG